MFRNGIVKQCVCRFICSSRHSAAQSGKEAGSGATVPSKTRLSLEVSQPGQRQVDETSKTVMPNRQFGVEVHKGWTEKMGQDNTRV